MQPFQPVFGSNQVLAPAAASAPATLSSPFSSQLRVINTGTNIGYFRTYRAADGAQAATTADMPVAPGMATTISKTKDHDTIATISAAGTTFQVTAGEGW